MSKLMFASDLHGDLAATEAILDRFEREGASRLILLGDLLYHGPRNDLPPHYAPKRVIERLNGAKESLLAVRGNCDTEVDQMVLEFPILADYGWIVADGISIYLTHGHRPQPPLRPGDCLLCGHTHVSGFFPLGDRNLMVNPGSAAIPKNGTPAGYLILEDGVFSLRDLSGAEYDRLEWRA